MGGTTDKALGKPGVVCALALICTFLWGSAMPSIKAGYEIFHIGAQDSGSQILFAGYRFTLAGLITWVISSVGTKTFALPKKRCLEKL